MLQKRYALILLLFISPLHVAVLGQTQDSSYIKPKRATYIRSFEDKFYIKPLLTARSLSLTFEEENNRFRDIEYTPSINTYLGFGFYLFDVGFELSFQVPNDSQDELTYGRTKAFDVQANIYLNKWGADVAVQNYSGFYFEDPESHFSQWQSGDPFPQRSDLEMRNLQFNTFYIFNHEKFSYRSAFNQADMQLKKAGSFLLGISASSFRFSADSSLMPFESRSMLEENATLRAGRATVLGLLPGYTHNFIHEQLYLNLSLSLGPAHLWTRYTTENLEQDDIAIRAIFNVRAAAGYNSDTFFGGISLVSQSVNYAIDNLNVIGSSGNIKFFIGYRFLEKGILTKSIL
ncbi:DUF4421 domain-containing protein [Fulvivirga sp. M361]|nr:DUF4421 domain-containing protein [Fulvivirga sp. M361]